MALVDFAAHVQKYVARPWRVLRVGRRMSQTFVQQFCLNLADDKTHKAVVRRTNVLRNHWIRRLKELALRHLWFPHSRCRNPYSADFNLKNFTLTFQRCLFCRPSYLYFKWKKHKVFRPCNRFYFCPFCFARIGQWQYINVRGKLRSIAKHNPETRLILTCRVTQRVLLAPGFDPIAGCDNERVGEYARLLYGELRRDRAAYQKHVKTLSRKTLGSMWRSVVLPTDRGWILETRQILLHYPKIKLPVARQKRSRVTYLKSIKVADCVTDPDAEFYFSFGQFNRYPTDLLTGYAELVAAYLRAVDGFHTLSGTGVFRRAGRSLLQQFKKRHEHGEQESRATESAQTFARRSTVAPTA